MSCFLYIVGWGVLFALIDAKVSLMEAAIIYTILAIGIWFSEHTPSNSNTE